LGGQFAGLSVLSLWAGFTRERIAVGTEDLWAATRASEAAVAKEHPHSHGEHGDAEYRKADEKNGHH
jgi:hypothetical protein